MFNSNQSNTSGQWETLLETHERQAYIDLFTKVDGDNKGIALKDEAMAFFKKSSVPDNILAEIWEAADEENKGFLTTKEFCTALKLIACAQHGKLTSTPILSTNVPMPYFDGVVTKPPVTPARSNTIAAHPRTPSSPKTSSADTITTEERNNYIRVFQSSEPINGVITSDNATSIFLRSNLPSTTLQYIWDLADTRKSGTLNQTEFIIAMHYISATRNGTISSLPSTLPDSIYAAATGRLGTSLGRHNTTIRSPVMQQNTGTNLRPSPSLYNHPQQQQSLLNVSNDEYKKYKVLFQQLASDKGSISGADAVHFFRHSKLPEADLAQIWDLADTRSTGELTQNEFIVAMHLVNRRMTGEPIPTMLPASTFQLSSPMLSNNQLAVPPPLPTSQRPNNNPSSNSSFDLLGLGGPINDVQPTKTVSTASASSSNFNNAFSIEDQSTAINNNNNNDINNNNTNKALLENNLASIQSQVRTENSLIDTLQSQKQGTDNSVKVLEESIEKEKHHLETLKRTVQELEQHVKNQQTKKDNLTRELQTFRQESKHFQQRIDHYRQESKDLENEISELEKKKQQQPSSLPGNNNHSRSSATSSPFLTKSAITSPNLSNQIPTSPSLNNNNNNNNNIFSLSTPISDNDLFAKVQDVTSPTLSTTSSHTYNANTISTNNNNNSNNKATIDPFAHQKKVTSPSLNKLKQESETRHSSSSSTPNVDISEIEAKFPDLSTMEHDFDVNNHPTDTITSPKTTPASPPPTTTAPAPITSTSSSSIAKSPSLQQANIGAGASIFGITNNNNNNNNTNTKPSKYGFDLSLFEGTNETPTISSTHNTTSFKDDLTSIFSNTNSPNDNKNNEGNQNNNNSSNAFDSLFGVSSPSTNTNPPSSPQKQQDKPISFADAFF